MANGGGGLVEPAAAAGAAPEVEWGRRLRGTPMQPLRSDEPRL